MNEFVLVQFYLEKELEESSRAVLKSLCEFEPLPNSRSEFYDNTRRPWVLFAGRMEAQAATILKLRAPDLAERMVVSYVPDNLKDKYRT